MDPDMCLKAIRKSIREGRFKDAAEDFTSLDEWLSKGGELPREWADEMQPEAFSESAHKEDMRNEDNEEWWTE